MMWDVLKWELWKSVAEDYLIFFSFPEKASDLSWEGNMYVLLENKDNLFITTLLKKSVGVMGQERSLDL